MELTLSPADYERVRKKYPDAAPILLHKSKGADTTVPLLPKNKFLVKKSYTIGQFLYVVRHTLKLPPEKALFLFINNTLPTSSMTIGEAWNTYKSDDNALHMYYAAENTFGCVA
jgi:GABA(A) receptor-associated protein